MNLIEVVLNPNIGLLPTGASSSIPTHVPLANSVVPMKAIVPERFDCLSRMCSPTDIHSGRIVSNSLDNAALV